MPREPLTPAERRDKVAALLDDAICQAGGPYAVVLADIDRLARALEALERLVPLSPPEAPAHRACIDVDVLNRLEAVDAASERLIAAVADSDLGSDDFRGTRFEDLLEPLDELAGQYPELPRR